MSANTVKHYKKRPVVIQAIRLSWDTWSDVCEFVTKPYFDRGVYLDEKLEELGEGETSNKMGLRLNTLESTELTGSLLAVEGDWIIKGVKGEFYPCKPDIFEATYSVEPNPNCLFCKGLGWVCEEHPEKPWDAGTVDDCKCGGAGMPCQCVT